MTETVDRTAQLERIVAAIAALDARSGDRLVTSRHPLYVATFGAALMLLPLVAGMIGWPRVSGEDMRLYVIAGSLFVTVGGACMGLQALLAHLGQRARLRLALEMFEVDSFPGRIARDVADGASAEAAHIPALDRLRSAEPDATRG
ncbi:MAG: hypothetical protein U1F25_17280 [Rubrivivax sp.]